MTDRAGQQHTCMHFSPDDPMVRSYGLGAAALRYQQMGYAVLPLTPGMKRPHQMLGHEGGVWHATTDWNTAIGWWGQDKRAGVGIACGKVSQLVVVDLDVKHGADGPQEFARFADGRMPEGLPWARTPSGGTHLYLRTAPGEPVPNKKGILPGVDVQGDGAYVAAAPSMIETPYGDRPDGQRGGTVLVPYTWEGGCPCSAPYAPGWLLQWAATAEPVWSPPSAGGAGGGPADLDELSKTGLPGGSRNITLYRLACQQYGRCGTSAEGHEAVRRVLEPVLAATDRRDFGEGEVRTIMYSARSFVERERAKSEQAAQRAQAWLLRR